MKKIRKTYVTKTKQNKINHFTKALNMYLEGSNFSDVQQIVDIFTELVNYARWVYRDNDKLPNMNAKFFIEKILGYLGLTIEPRSANLRRKKLSDKENLWHYF